MSLTLAGHQGNVDHFAQTKSPGCHFDPCCCCCPLASLSSAVLFFSLFLFCSFCSCSVVAGFSFAPISSGKRYMAATIHRVVTETKTTKNEMLQMCYDQRWEEGERGDERDSVQY
eukprot:GILK01007105.1.p1 GENE.GILK01007105.1~~GILK01007105.1.p1  ORF type:complete len:115 (+),score=6.95 GILK01007105.1:496-840(+)